MPEKSLLNYRHNIRSLVCHQDISSISLPICIKTAFVTYLTMSERYYFTVKWFWMSPVVGCIPDLKNWNFLSITSCVCINMSGGFSIRLHCLETPLQLVLLKCHYLSYAIIHGPMGCISKRTSIDSGVMQSISHELSNKLVKPIVMY